MPYKVKVDHPSAGDQDIYISGLGTFRNGTEIEVDDEQAMRYRVMNAVHEQGIWDEEGNYVGPHDEDGKFQTRTTLAPEPSDLEIPGFTITKVEASASPPPNDGLDDATRAQMEADAKEAGQ